MSSTEGALAGRSSREIEARKGERRAVALSPTGPAGISVDALVGGRCAPRFWGSCRSAEPRSHWPAERLGYLGRRKPGGHSKSKKGRGAGARAPGPSGQPGSRRWRPLSRAQGAAAVSLAQRQKLHPAWAHGTWFPTRLGLWWAARFASLSRLPRAMPGEGAHPRVPIPPARLVHGIKVRTMETRVRHERFLWGFHPGVGHNLYVFAGKKDGRGTVSQLLARGSRCEHSHRVVTPSRAYGSELGQHMGSASALEECWKNRASGREAVRPGFPPARRVRSGPDNSRATATSLLCSLGGRGVPGARCIAPRGPR